MIGRLNGLLLESAPPLLLVDCHGVGYEVWAPMSTCFALPPCGQPVTLLTHLAVREDAHQLYGFATAAEREAFRALIRINGVGARMALAVLSGMSVDALAQAIAEQNAALLTRVPGIGKKTAERLLLELKGKLAGAEAAASAPKNAAHADISQALIALGYSEKEAAAALRALPENISVNDGIRQALAALGK